MNFQKFKNDIIKCKLDYVTKLATLPVKVNEINCQY